MQALSVCLWGAPAGREDPPKGSIEGVEDPSSGGQACVADGRPRPELEEERQAPVGCQGKATKNHGCALAEGPDDGLWLIGHLNVDEQRSLREHRGRPQRSSS
eukprot:1005153-Alexandrium_andersonii.AAC.1